MLTVFKAKGRVGAANQGMFRLRRCVLSALLGIFFSPHFISHRRRFFLLVSRLCLRASATDMPLVSFLAGALHRKLRAVLPSTNSADAWSAYCNELRRLRMTGDDSYERNLVGVYAQSMVTSTNAIPSEQAVSTCMDMPDSEVVKTVSLKPPRVPSKGFILPSSQGNPCGAWQLLCVPRMAAAGRDEWLSGASHSSRRVRLFYSCDDIARSGGSAALAH